MRQTSRSLRPVSSVLKRMPADWTITNYASAMSSSKQRVLRRQCAQWSSQSGSSRPTFEWCERYCRGLSRGRAESACRLKGRVRGCTCQDDGCAPVDNFRTFWERAWDFPWDFWSEFYHYTPFVPFFAFYPL